MEKEVEKEVPNALLEGQAEVWLCCLCIYRAVETMVLKCAVELRIADIMHSHATPITLSQIANGIGSPSLDLSSLARIMRLLVHMKIFDADSSSKSSAGSYEETTLYSLNASSKWLLHDNELSLAPYVAMIDRAPISIMKFISESVKEGGGTTAFQKAHGVNYWEFASLNPEFRRNFCYAMEFTSRISIKAMLTEYKDGFDSIGSLVDVGGATGFAVAEIVKAHPHVKGTNFDLPQIVLEAAQVYPGLAHVGGDMFESIPPADAILMKRILHDWTDEDCIRILKNCRKAIPEKTGKVIILDAVLHPGGDGWFDEVGLIYDVMMLAQRRGKERSEIEWKRVLEGGGFRRYKIIKIPALESIIEAYPE